MEKDSMSVAMDMLNEVKRCPSELFDTLSMDDKSRFRIISADYNEALQWRSSDRFAQLLLQYIDYGELFKNIRFHVNMGKLRYLFNAEKKCIDGETRVRVLEHPLNGFGRIGEVEEQRRQEDLTFADTGIRIRDFESMERDDANPGNYPYVVDTYTRYMLDNNKVEMSFCGGMRLPHVENDNGKWYVDKDIPSCRMSTFELSAMAFHMLLLGADKTEARIGEVYDNYVHLFEAMSRGEVTRENLAGFGIAERDIPKKVLDCLDGCAKGKDVRLFIETAVNGLREDTEKRIARLKADRMAIGTRDNKMGRRGFRKISTGALADFLAKDIVRFQPDNNGGKDKLTGLNYRVMQASIATYDSLGNQETKTKFKQMFEDAKLLGTNSGKNHPFLHKVFARTIPENAIAFYERYLAERRIYLESLSVKICKGKNIDVPFVNKNRNRWKTPVLESLGETYRKNSTIELPRQMFDADIKEELRKMPQMNGIDFDSANVTCLIGEYLRRVQGDDFQIFYSWNRNYDYMDMLNGKFDRRGALCHNCISQEKREGLWQNREEQIKAYRRQIIARNRELRSNGRSEEDMEESLDRRIAHASNDYQKSEKTIRRYKVQDALLFMMVKKVLTATADFDGGKFKLKEIMPDADKGILSEMMPMTFRFTKGGKKYTIKTDSIKLKNYGNFFVLANDKRLPPLMELVGTDTVSKEQLEEEFRNYDTCRPEVVSLIFDVEKWAFDNYPELQQMVDNYEKVDFKRIIDILGTNNNIGRQQGYVLRQIRNAFDHNGYPEKGKLEITTLPQIARSMTELFGRYAELIKNDKNGSVEALW
ncbi:MAG: type VI-B CRISPR-associated RNA-guided ribonuclease Cas13b [Bacteroidales bacterium]|nr:type VI-B CRISPR-associated RNA-guided ribonuclease Cas13b [Bacteroidales bacterium]